jgi:uncharacterized protein
MDERFTAVAEIPTPQASRYLSQLCKHFQHKIPVTLEDGSGQITFPMGICTLHANADLLTLSVDAADSAQLA